MGDLQATRDELAAKEVAAAAEIEEPRKQHGTTLRLVSGGGGSIPAPKDLGVPKKSWREWSAPRICWSPTPSKISEDLRSAREEVKRGGGAEQLSCWRR